MSSICPVLELGNGWVIRDRTVNERRTVSRVAVEGQAPDVEVRIMPATLISTSDPSACKAEHGVSYFVGPDTEIFQDKNGDGYYSKGKDGDPIKAGEFVKRYGLRFVDKTYVQLSDFKSLVNIDNPYKIYLFDGLNMLLRKHDNSLTCTDVVGCRKSVFTYFQGKGFNEAGNGSATAIAIANDGAEAALLTEAKLGAKKDIKALLEKIIKECNRVEPQIAKLNKKWEEAKKKAEAECLGKYNGGTSKEPHVQGMLNSLCYAEGLSDASVERPGDIYTNAFFSVDTAQKVAIEYGIYDELLPLFDKARARLEQFDKAIGKASGIDKVESKDQGPGFPIKNVP